MKRVVLTITILLFLAPLVLQPLGDYVQPAEATVTGGIEGHIYSSHYNRPVKGVFVTLERGIYRQIHVTDKNGRYEFNPPAGTYNLTITYKDQTIDSVHNITIVDGVMKSYDVSLTVKLDERVLIKGHVLDNGAVNQNLKVNITGLDNYYWNLTHLDKYGYYEMFVPEGIFNLSIIDLDGNVIETKRMIVTSNSTTIEVNMDVNTEKSISYLTYNDILNHIFTNWYWIIILLAFFFLMIFLYVRLAYYIERIKAKDYKYLNHDAKTLLARIVKVSYFFVVIYILLYISNRVITIVEQSTFDYFSGWFRVAFYIFIVFILARLSLIIKDNIISFTRQKSLKKNSKMTSSMLMIIDMFLKYTIILFFGFLAIIAVLVQLGMYDILAEAIIRFFIRNIGYLSFLTALVIIAYAFSKFMESFTEDLAKRNTHMSRSMVSTVGKILSISINTILVFIVLFTILSMAGMSDIGSTIMIILSTMIGLVVAMAATGSIGNILSGLVIQSMKPFEIGDRVVVGEDILGDVMDVNMMFTKIRTLRSEYLDVPNNIIMANKITNLSRSGAVGIDIDLSIGYDVPAKNIFDLIKIAAMNTPGILHDPKPQVFAIDFLDYAIKYRLRAFVNKPLAIPATRSNLIRRIQETFYKNGIEILSPWYIVRREDKIPESDVISARFKDAIEKREERVSEDVISAGMSMFADMDAQEEQGINNN